MFITKIKISPIQDSPCAVCAQLILAVAVKLHEALRLRLLWIQLANMAQQALWGLSRYLLKLTLAFFKTYTRGLESISTLKGRRNECRSRWIPWKCGSPANTRPTALLAGRNWWVHLDRPMAPVPKFKTLQSVSGSISAIELFIWSTSCVSIISYRHI